MITLEEQERRAYASGEVELATILAHAVDGDEELQQDLQLAEEQRDAASKEAEEAEIRNSELEDQLTAAQATLKALNNDLVALANKY